MKAIDDPTNYDCDERVRAYAAHFGGALHPGVVPCPGAVLGHSVPCFNAGYIAAAVAALDDSERLLRAMDGYFGALEDRLADCGQQTRDSFGEASRSLNEQLRKFIGDVAERVGRSPAPVTAATRRADGDDQFRRSEERRALASSAVSVLRNSRAREARDVLIALILDAWDYDFGAVSETWVTAYERAMLKRFQTFAAERARAAARVVWDVMLAPGSTVVGTREEQAERIAELLAEEATDDVEAFCAEFDGDWRSLRDEIFRDVAAERIARRTE